MLWAMCQRRYLPHVCFFYAVDETLCLSLQGAEGIHTQGGLEILCELLFTGDTKYMEKAKH